MARHLSVSSVIDKNKVSSDVPWVALIELHLVDPNDRSVLEVVRIARNSENVTFGGETYVAGNFELQIQQRQNEAPNVSLTAKDPTGMISSKMEAVAGGVFSEVVMIAVNTDRLDRPAETVQRFKVLTAANKNYVITAQLGAENPLDIVWPPRRQFQDRCAWRYKGYGCGYTGGMPSCSYTKDGPNGCSAHFPGQPLPIKALPGLVRMNI